jgi:hypothetical protein
MLKLLMHYRTAWKDYFTGNHTLMQNIEYKTRQTPSDTGVYILNCLFRSISSSSSGGALYCSDSVQYFLVESSSFFSCKTSISGGAIYFINTNNGQYVLQGVCGYDCRSTSGGYGPFSYNQVYDVVSSKNYINFSSISRCGITSSPSYMICHHYGTHCYPSVNISMNKCYDRSGIYCAPSVDSNSVTSSLSYSTIADNIATQHTCIQLLRTDAKHEIKSCNILRNTQGNLGSQGTIATFGNTMIKDCCILENIATYIFYSSSSSYTITLSNCTVDSTSSYRNLITQNTVTKSFILALNHISTQNCHSEYDSAGTLTPIIQSPSSSKKQKNCYTFAYVFSLSNILIFNFIHPYTSGDLLY